jgi:hypothetical protein
MNLIFLLASNDSLGETFARGFWKGVGGLLVFGFFMLIVWLFKKISGQKSDAESIRSIQEQLKEEKLTAWEEIRIEREKQNKINQQSSTPPIAPTRLCDKNGNTLSKEQERIARNVYEFNLTPTIKALIDASSFKADISCVVKHVSIPPFVNDENYIMREILAGMIGLIGTELTIQFDGILDLHPKMVWIIADDMLGHPEHDFQWLARTHNLRWRGSVPTTKTNVQQSERPQYTYVEEKICVDEYVEKKEVTPTVRHIKCGTPFLEARRREANNDHGWKDVTGHILTNEEFEFLRKYYFVYMTPVVHKMFDEEWEIKNDFDYITSRSTFPQKPYTEREFEVHFYYNMMMPIIESLIPKYFVADRELTEKDIYNISDDILGEQDHDFDWLYREYGLKWKNR